MSKFNWVIRDVEDNGEFLSWATVDYIADGKVIESETFCGTSEEPPGYTGYELAQSARAVLVGDAGVFDRRKAGPVRARVPTGTRGNVTLWLCVSP